MEGLDELEKKESAARLVHKWPKHEHLSHMEESKCFSFTKEVYITQKMAMLID